MLVTHLIHQILTQVVIGHAELLPPVSQHLFHFTNVRAQAHEVKRSPKTGLVDQAEWRTAHPLLKPGLHHPYLTHVTGQLAPPGHIANAGVEDIVYRILQGGV